MKMCLGNEICKKKYKTIRVMTSLKTILILKFMIALFLFVF